MSHFDTLEIIINRNICSNFFYNNPDDDKVNKIYKDGYNILLSFSNDISKIDKNLFHNNTYCLINTFNSINNLLTKLLIIINNINNIFSNLDLNNYIKLKNIFIFILVPMYTNNHNKFIIYLKKFNIEINRRIIDLLKSNGYDFKKCNDKYNDDIDTLNKRLKLINNNISNILTNIKLV